MEKNYWLPDKNAPVDRAKAVIEEARRSGMLNEKNDIPLENLGINEKEEPIELIEKSD